MKVLMLNSFDRVGGADRAATRLLKGVKSLGVDASLMVQFRFDPESDVICEDELWRRSLRRLKLYLGTLPVRIYPNRPVNNFTPALFGDRLPSKVDRLAPDLVHLQWLGAGFCGIESIGAFTPPVVWTLHDSWPFTGGCHVPGPCTRYRESCGACPVLGSRTEHDLSRRTWSRKERAWRNQPLTLVAPSRWLADCAASSSLFAGRRIEVIPNGLDTALFRPMEKEAARRLLGLPQERPLILFGAVNALSDRNKGWHLLQPALKLVAECLPEATAVVFGGDQPASPPDLGMEARFLGHLKDDPLLAAAYAAADVMVVPSLQEAFCQTATEAMACGTPVVAFGATGLLDVVGHGETGYLARPYKVEDLAAGILWVLSDRERRAALSERGVHKVNAEFAIDKTAARYLEIYRRAAAVTSLPGGRS
jgi:glycosyltransferase involved in cell wall biosynthesis